ncbi:hypothetical protein [Rickettsiella endosymbiont of Dermanyssus gallinae]|uniref:hypothetical protein n=1 Tax=Rickettsiella endosymbiont of Dermanyssus gallinae TaxID=2856608 RepID=UPI001C52B50D|nr:hypothetical protein [Rickettsiella endosymbiont of Dermanyssus gallinae]
MNNKYLEIKNGSYKSARRIKRADFKRRPDESQDPEEIAFVYLDPAVKPQDDSLTLFY